MLVHLEVLALRFKLVLMIRNAMIMIVLMMICALKTILLTCALIKLRRTRSHNWSQ